MGIQLKGTGRALRPSGLGTLRPKPTGRGGKPLKPKPMSPGKAQGGSVQARPDQPRDKRKKIDPKMDTPRDKLRKKKFPDLTGDGKVTRADVLKGRGVFASGGKAKDPVKDKGAFETESRRQRQKQRQRIKRIGEGLRDINPLPLPKLKKKDK